MTAELHPWLDTPEALAAAHKSVAIPKTMMGGKAAIVGYDELASEALAILTECALPPRDRMPTSCANCGGSLDLVRVGAKFCTPKCRMAHGKRVERAKAEAIPARTGGHVGSMWDWPADQMTKYAVREVGYALNNWLRTRNHTIETPASEAMANMNLVSDERADTPRETIESYLESKGVRVVGDETFEELAEAVQSLLKVTA